MNKSLVLSVFFSLYFVFVYGQSVGKLTSFNEAIIESSVCDDQDAGLVTLSSASAQSIQVDVDSVTFLCSQDQFVVKNSGSNLTSDPNPATAPGIGYVFYSCSPTVSGTSLTEIENDPCILNSPPPTGSTNEFWTYTDQIDGTAVFRNSDQLGGQTIPEFFNSGNPVQIYYAPITLDNFDLQSDEDGGACVDVSVEEAFPVVYLNPIEVSNFTLGIDGNPLAGSFVITGGLSEYNGTNYSTLHVAKNSNLMNKAELIGGPFKHGDLVNFIAPENGNYTILIEDDVSCGYSQQYSIFEYEKSTTFDINFAKSTAKVGESVCAEITVKDFQDIQSFEYSLLFDSNVLRFLNFQNFGLVDFTVFNTFSVFANQGFMTVQWFDPSTVGKSLNDGDVLFEVCFETIGDPGDCSSFDISGWPTPVQAVCCDNYEIPIEIIHNDDEICIVPDDVMDIVGSTCGSSGAELGALSFYVVGGVAPYTYSIMELNSSGILPKEKFEYTINNLSSGIYTLEIVDSNGVVKTKQVLIDNSVPINFDLELFQPTCYGLTNGKMKIKNLTGGSAEYKYHWSNKLSDVDSIMGLSAGTYFVTVEDKNGCREERQTVLGLEPLELNVTVIDTATCLEVSDGVLKASASGGTSFEFDSYNYQFIEPFQNYTNVSEVTHSGIPTGKWPVIVKDKNGCSIIDSFSMPFKKEVVVNSTVEQGDCGEGLGSIHLEASTTNGVGENFVFDWSSNASPAINTSTTSTIKDLDEGSYSAIITDADGCKTTEQYEIDLGVKLFLNGMVEYDCSTGGCIYLFPSGLNTNVEWGDISTGETTRCGLNPGTYEVTVTDLNGCSADSSFVIDTNPDYAALLAFYKSTNGDNWINNSGWKDGADSTNCSPCDGWYGVHCTNGRVDSITLSGNNLLGYIPNEIGDISKLRALDLSKNDLSSIIPSEFQNLLDLDLLRLNDNDLFNCIDFDLKKFLCKIDDFSLYNNPKLPWSGDENKICLYSSFIGAPCIINGENGIISEDCSCVPEPCGNHPDYAPLMALFASTNGDDWFNNTGWKDGVDSINCSPCNGWYGVYCQNGRVDSLSLSKNNLKGEIPKEISGLTKLSGLNLSDNYLTGSIPTEINDMSYLSRLLLYKNNLSNCIEEVLFDKMCNSTMSANLNENPLLPWEGNLNKICMYGVDNQIGAPCLLDNEVGVINQDCQCLPDTNSFHPDCEGLLAIYNSTDGDNWINNTGWDAQDTFCDPCNGWYGVTCNGLGRVVKLDLSSNNLNGILPDELGSVSKLVELNIGNNIISGEIPVSIGNLLNLEKLYLLNNAISGEIPAELGKLNHLSELLLQQNELNGVIPKAIEGLKSLKQLYLANNKLSGTIPSELGNLPLLEEISLDFNNLTGAIPSSLSNLELLKKLKLDNNNFNGCYDPNLLDLCKVSELDFTNNPLLPWKGDFVPFCDSDGSIQAQQGAPCDDGIPENGSEDLIIDCECSGTVHIINEMDVDLVVYPIPGNDKLYIEKLTFVPYRIFDTYGRQLKGDVYIDEIDVSDLFSGIYVLQVFYLGNWHPTLIKITR